MKSLHSLTRCWQTGLALAVAGLLAYAFSSGGLAAADSKPAKSEKAKSSDKKSKKFTGAELYAMHCNRCHPERYATERTAAQWKTIMLHMRVRANLPAEQAKAIAKYLQEDSGK